MILEKITPFTSELYLNRYLLSAGLLLPINYEKLKNLKSPDLNNSRWSGYPKFK